MIANLKGIRKSDITKIVCEKSFYGFFKRAWPHFVHEQYIDGWHIKTICDHLQAIAEGRLSNPRLLIAVPPRCSKSLICSVAFPAWLWIRNPSFKLFTGSHSDDNRTRDTVASRDLMSSEWFQFYWGDKIQFKKDQNQKLWYENIQGGKRASFTVNGGVTGAGGNGIDLDDPLDIGDRYSKVKRDQTNSWIGQGLATRLDDKLKGLIWIVMQRLHKDDPIGYLMRTQPELWNYLCLPMEFEEETRCITPIFKDPRKKDGDLLWSEKITAGEIVIIKKFLGDDYAGQYQQRPSTLEGNIIKRDSWRYISNEEIDRIHFDCYIQSWDTAWETKTKNDYSVCITFGVKGYNFYIVNIFRAKIEYVELKEKMYQLNNRYNPIAICVEDASSGKTAIQELKRPVEGRPILPIVAIKVAGGPSKEVRARAITPLLCNQQVFINSSMIELHEFIEECSIFPNGSHDDQVDALSQGLSYLAENFGRSLINISII